MLPRVLRASRWRRAWIVAAILLTCGAASVAMPVVNAIGELRAGVSLLSDLIPPDIYRPGTAVGTYCNLSSWRDDGPNRLERACSHFASAAPVARPLAALVRPIGAVHELRGWGQLGDALEVVLSLCTARTDINRVADSAVPSDAQPGEHILRQLERSRAPLTTMSERVNDAITRLERIDPDAFAGPLAPAAQPFTQLRKMVPFLGLVREFGTRPQELAGSALGVDQPRRYLILGQDNAELRPSGGIIESIGVVELVKGRVARSEFRPISDWDSTSIAARRAPDALERYLNIDALSIEYMNWWVDYQRTVLEVADYWRRSYGEEVDGVIAVDRRAVRRLLEALGGVEVPELGRRVTSDTAYLPLEEDGRAEAQDRTILGTRNAYLLRALSAATSSGMTSGVDRARVIAALACGLQTRQVLLGFNDPVLAHLAKVQRWDGGLPDEHNDLISIVDTNLSSGKVGPYIRKRALYQRREAGLVVLTISYSNTYVLTPGSQWDPVIGGEFWDWRARVFRRSQGAWLGLVRVVVPPDTRLVSAEGWDDVPATDRDERGRVLFGAPLLVYPGATRTARFVYELPPFAQSGGLTVAAQPGGLPYSLNVVLPTGPLHTLQVEGSDIAVDPR